MTLTTAGLMWLIMGVICFVLEMMLPSFVLFFFGLGAWVTALACWFYPVAVNAQLAIFLVSSLLSLFLFRNIIRKTFFGDISADEEDAIVNLGDRATVVEDIIPPAEGRIDYSGSKWRASADEMIEKGTIVTILSRDGLSMKVARVEEQA